MDTLTDRAVRCAVAFSFLIATKMTVVQNAEDALFVWVLNTMRWP